MNLLLVILLTLVSTHVGQGIDDSQFRIGDGDVIATIDDRIIELRAFRVKYVDYLNSTGQPDSDRLRLSFLESQIAQDLVIRQMKQNYIPKEGDEIEFGLIRRKLLIEGYLSSSEYSTIMISENDLREMFVRTKTSLKASHLYAPTKALADSLYRLLQRGSDFATLAQETFLDSSLAESGGSVGYFEFDEMDPAFEDAAYSLEVGQYSTPIRTAQGYSIVKLDDKFIDPLLTESEYATRKDRIHTYVLMRKRADARRDFLRSISEELQPVVHGGAVDALYARIHDGAEREGEDSDLPLDTAILTTSRGSLTIADILDEARYISDDLRAQVDTREDLVALSRGIATRLRIVELAILDEVETLTSYRQAYDDAVDDWHYRRAWEEWKTDVHVSDSEAQDYLSSNRHNFLDVVRRDVWEILVDDPELMMVIRSEVEPDTFKSLARNYSLRPGAADVGGFLGSVSRKELGVAAQSIFAADDLEIVGPMRIGSHYAIFLAGKKHEPVPPALSDVRDEVVNTIYQDKLRARIETSVASMRDAADVWIDYQNLYQFSLSSSSSEKSANASY